METWKWTHTHTPPLMHNMPLHTLRQLPATLPAASPAHMLATLTSQTLHTQAGHLNRACSGYALLFEIKPRRAWFLALLPAPPTSRISRRFHHNCVQRLVQYSSMRAPWLSSMFPLAPVLQYCRHFGARATPAHQIFLYTLLGPRRGGI